MSRSLEPVRRAQASALAMVPALFAPRPDAAKRFLEFFAAQIRNPNTRKAYFRAVSRFAGWCELNGLTELVDLEPVHVAAYVEQLGKQLSPPSVKQHLAAIRMLCDWLVVGQVIATNPAAPVRGPASRRAQGQDAGAGRRGSPHAARFHSWRHGRRDAGPGADCA